MNKSNILSPNWPHREMTLCWAQNVIIPKHDYGQTSLKEEFYNIVSLWKAEIILQLTYKYRDIIKILTRKTEKSTSHLIVNPSFELPELDVMPNENKCL